MSARFVIVVEAANAELQDAITNYLKDLKQPFWHWIENLWLLVDESGILDADRIWKRLQDDIPGLSGKHMVVLGVDSNRASYGGFLPNASWAWLTQYWSEESRKLAQFGNS